MTTITYSPSLYASANEKRTINAANYEAVCKNKKSCFEYIPDDRHVKLYFDVDIKNDADTYDGQLDAAPRIKELVLDFLTEQLGSIGKEPNIGVYSSHSACYTSYKQDKSGNIVPDKKLWKISFHFVVSNFTAYKSDQGGLVKDFNKTLKRYYGDLIEYLEDENDNIFDESPYDKNRRMRSVHCSKDRENRPMIIEDGTFEQSVISAFIDEDHVEMPHRETPIAEPRNDFTPTTSDNDVARWMDYTNILKPSLANYHNWYKFQIATFNLGIPYDIYDTQMKTGAGNYDADKNKTVWDNNNKNHDRKVGWNTIKTMAFERDPVKTNEIDRKYKFTDISHLIETVNAAMPVAVPTVAAAVADESAMITVGILEKGENDVAQFITPILKNNVVFCRNQWFVFDKNTGLWVVKHPSASIISCIQLKIDEAMGHLHLDMSRTGDTSGDRYKAMKETSKQLKGHYSKVCKCGYTSSVVNFLKDYLSDDGFVDKLDKQTYVAVFEDGLLDLKTLTFRSGIKQTDFVSKTIPFKYEKPKDEDIAFVREVIKKICNYKEEHLDYYLSTLGYALTGDASMEQLFWYLRGQTAENGKSFIFETLEELMPCYVSKGSSDVLDKGADIRKDLATWRALRILWLNEVSTRAKDEDLTKALCDGTNYKNKELYSIKTVSVDISFKLFGVSNKTLKIDGDAGVKRRFRLMQFNSQFKDDYDCDYETLKFKRDKELGAKLQGQYKHALLHLIFTYSKHYADEKRLRPYPDEWKEEADEVMDENDKFASWFNDRFVVGADKMISKKDFEYLVSLLPMKGVNVKDELKRMRVAFKYDSQMRKREEGKIIKGWYVGFCEKPTDMDECA